MRRSRQFRPSGPVALEDRVVLSHVSPLAHPPAHAKRAAVITSTPTPDNVIKGSVGEFHGLSMAQTVQAGDPVYQQITTEFADPAAKTVTAADTQAESRLVVPDKAAGTVTTTHAINLRNGAGPERIVDVATTTGATIKHEITITLPGGGVETETETDLVQGNKTLMKGTIYLPGGSTKTFTGTSTNNGNQVVTDQTFVDPEGFASRVHTVVTINDELSQNTVVTTTYSDGTTTTTNSRTSVLRLPPPSV